MDQASLDIAGRLAAVLVLVLTNGFFVAAEFAIVTVRKTRIDQLIAEGHGRAIGVRQAISASLSFICWSIRTCRLRNPMPLRMI